MTNSVFGMVRIPPDEGYILVPYWFPVMLTASLPSPGYTWMQSKFSLRTLLIATTLIAVVLGLVVAFGRSGLQNGRTGCPRNCPVGSLAQTFIISCSWDIRR